MTRTQYETMILARPLCRAWGADVTVKKAAIKTALDFTINEICTASDDFDFAQEEYIGTSVANVAAYVIKGDNRNCRGVKDIRFGSDRALLDKYTKTEAHDYLSGAYVSVYGNEDTPTRTAAGLAKWYISREVQGFPEITFIGVPPAGESFYAWIYIRNVNIIEIPDEWGFVVVRVAEEDLFGGNDGTKALAKMVGRYRRRGAQDQPYPVSDLTKSQNRRRNALSGYDNN